jgi:predicted nucleic acid-binding protein
MQILLDTGPWVALLSARDTHHAWAREQFARIEPPLLTCEAVVAETCFVLARARFDPAKALMMIERGVVAVDFDLAHELTAVRGLFERYGNVPASLADACLVRMSELHPDSRVLTLDSDFSVYRRLGRRVIPLITP